MATQQAPLDSTTATDKELLPGPIVFVIGPPASGKGTLCSRLCQQIPDSFAHLSVGDYLRELCSAPRSEDPPAEDPQPDGPRLQPSAEGAGRLPREEIAECLQDSRLLPPGTIVPLIKEKLLEGQSSPGHGWVIDGFPRDIETARAFEKEVRVPSLVIVIRCSPPFARERFLKRRRSSTDDHGFFDKRLEQYNEKLGPICDRYRDITTVVNTNGTKDESWGNLVQAVRTLPGFEGLHMFG